MYTYTCLIFILYNDSNGKYIVLHIVNDYRWSAIYCTVTDFCLLFIYSHRYTDTRIAFLQHTAYDTCVVL